jgi:hypothetical protein
MLFDNFIKQYVDDLIECSDNEYKLTDEEKEEIIDNIRYNEAIWEILDNAIFNELEKYNEGSE